MSLSCIDTSITGSLTSKTALNVLLYLAIYIMALILMMHDPVHAEEIASFGGNIPCSTFMSNKAIADQSGAWVFGFRSGLNVMAFMNHQPHDIGHTVKPGEIITEVLTICEAKIELTISAATVIAWNRAKLGDR